MKHFGDITKINGADVPIVDIVCGGSPCQDLSVAGKRAGLAGERSGLFMEQIRIIKEMMNESIKQLRSSGSDVDLRLVRPRYMVWENVPGAFSSNGGEDFRAVLEETAHVADENAVIPRPSEKWGGAGCIMGNGWSIAWRVHDAQFWGVPQRRRRIALVADFGGDTAPKILFESEGLSGDFETSREEGQEVTGTVGENFNKAISFQERAGKPGGGKGILIQHERTGALSTLNNQPVCYGISSYDSNAMKSSNPHSGIYEAETTRTLDLNGGNPACNQGGMIVLEGNGSRPSHKGDGYVESDTMYTLNSTEHHAVCVENHPADSRVQIKDDGVVQTLSGRMGTGGGNVPLLMEQCSWDGSQVAPTLTSNNANGAQRMPDKDNFNAVLTYGLDRASFNQGKNAQYDFAIEEEKIGTQVAKGPGAVCQSIVRRLTPLECERLQGFPDHWTDIGEWVDTKGKVHKDADSPRYKALGNSIALPFWEWMAKRMVNQLAADGVEHPTMASLFDGIGGFPLVYSRAECEPIWASEIEEFPIAVTKIHFPEKEATP